jgi:NAD(P)-dependent dehydrogenase (short-subunit alcohol dehydrogenase family)
LLLADRRIVVTGASGGIGRAIALACAREGAALGLGHLRGAESARALQAEIEALGRKAQLLPFDVTDSKAVVAAAEAFATEQGGIDAWVSSAGVCHPGLLLTEQDDRIRAQIDVNLLGPVFAARAALPFMIRQRGGVLLHIGSVAAVRPARGQAVYAATKGAIESLTKALAVEYARKGVRALCLVPGAVETGMLQGTMALAAEEVTARIPLRRVATPAEIAETAVFLLSDKARYMTGASVAVDGGYLIA